MTIVTSVYDFLILLQFKWKSVILFDNKQSYLYLHNGGKLKLLYCELTITFPVKIIDRYQVFVITAGIIRLHHDAYGRNPQEQTFRLKANICMNTNLF